MDEPIAIIGLDARFPGSDDGVEGFHDLLLRGRSARSQVPTDRYDAKSFWHPDGERAGSVRCVVLLTRYQLLTRTDPPTHWSFLEVQRGGF